MSIPSALRFSTARSKYPNGFRGTVARFFHQETTGLSTPRCTSPSTTKLVLNLERPYFQDKRVRQAMMYALDREAIIREIFKGEAELINQSIIGPEWMGALEGLNPYKYDPNKAKQLLTEANWDSNQEGRARL